MELERHLDIHNVTILPLAVQGKVGTRFGLHFFLFAVHFYIKTFGGPLWHSQVQVKFPLALDGQLGVIFFRESCFLLNGDIFFGPFQSGWNKKVYVQGLFVLTSEIDGVLKLGAALQS